MTAEEVTIVLHMGNISNPAPDRWVDYSAPQRSQDTAEDQYARSFARFFSDRYQSYGRRVRFWGFRSVGDSASESRFRADVVAIEREKEPFAIVPFSTRPEIVGDEAATRKIVAVTYFAFPRAAYQAKAPFLVSFNPDLEDQANIWASYICTKVAGRPARFAPDPTYHNRRREFGAFFVDDPARTANFKILKDLLKQEMRERCGETIKQEVALRPSAADYTPAAAQMRGADVTTVITVFGSGFSSNMSAHAGAQHWYPEWIVGASGDELGNTHAASAQLHHQAVWKGAFGINYDYRRGKVEDQPWYQAYREGCGSCAGGGAQTVTQLYDQLGLLMYGIQAAGPRLSPQSFDKGLHSIPQRGSPDPFRPAAYFAPGNYSFVKDAMQVWWDGVSTAEGDSRPGCYRVPEGGLRYRASEWHGDDSLLFSDGPCQGPPSKAA